MGKLLSIHEAAEFLNLAEITLYKYVAARKIPFIKIGKRVLFKQEKLDEWIESRSVLVEGGNNEQ